MEEEREANLRSSKSKLRVLVADGLSQSRLVLETILCESRELEVCGLAADGEQLLQLLHKQKADVVLASVSLKHNKDLLVFKRVFSECPTPIVMLVEQEQLTLSLLKEAIGLGVYGVVLKPGKSTRPNYRQVAEEIRRKVLAVRASEYGDPVLRLRMLGEETQLVQPLDKPHLRNSTADTIIVIGASTGGTQAVAHIVRQLSPALNAAVLVAIHLPPKFTHSYSQRLRLLSGLNVIEGRTGLIPKPGKVIVAPGGRNMVVQAVMGNKNSLRIGFNEEEGHSLDQPSVDQLMETVAQSGVKRVIGVILTGMGRDGTLGVQAIANREGGHVIAQDEESSVIFGMAKSAIESGSINKVLPLSKIATYLNDYVAADQQVSVTGAKHEIERAGV